MRKEGRKQQREGGLEESSSCSIVCRISFRFIYILFIKPLYPFFSHLSSLFFTFSLPSTYSLTLLPPTFLLLHYYFFPMARFLSASYPFSTLFVLLSWHRSISSFSHLLFTAQGYLLRHCGSKWSSDGVWNVVQNGDLAVSVMWSKMELVFAV